MKKILSLLISLILLINGAVSVQALTVGDERYNFFNLICGDMSCIENYDKYLENLKKERAKEYSTEELSDIYNQISFYLINRQSIDTDNKELKNLFNSLMFINIRADNIYNCVEVVIKDLSEKKIELFKEYICDSDAVVLWGLSLPVSPEYAGVVEVEAKAAATSIKLKSGNVKNIPLANKSKVKIWKSSSAKTASVKNGKISALKKGKTTITAVYNSAVEVNIGYEVVNSPVLKLNGKKTTSISLKKKKSKTLSISGKVSSINNKYKNTKTAKITSNKNASKIKVKGLKKGKTTIKITVNNTYTINLKVNVK